MLPNRTLGLWAANFVGNLGDYAILEGTSSLLQQALPGWRLQVAPHAFTGEDPERTACFRREHAQAFQFIEGPPFTQADRAYGWLRRLGLPRHAANRYLLRKALARLRRDLLLARWASNVSGCLLAGGGHWGWDELTVNLLAQIRWLQEMGKPVFLLPHSMSKSVLEHLPSKLSGGLLGRCAMVALRDKYSTELARSLGADRAFWCPDCAFAMNVASPPESASENGRAVAQKPSRIVLALRASPRRQEAAYLRILAGLAERIRKAGADPLLLTTCEADDHPLFDRARADLPQLAQRRPLSPSQALEILGGAAAVVTDRFHCLVFGMLAGVPVVPMGDLEKVSGMADTAALPIRLQGEDELDAAALSQMANRRREIVGLQNRFVSSAREHLRALGSGIAMRVAACET